MLFLRAEILLQHKDIADESLIDILEECERITADRPITFFEITTAAAFLAFALLRRFLGA